MRPVPVASLRLLSIALYVDDVPVYNAGDSAFTARCPLALPYPFFGSRPPWGRSGRTCALESNRRTRST